MLTKSVRNPRGAVYNIYDLIHVWGLHHRSGLQWDKISLILGRSRLREGTTFKLESWFCNATDSNRATSIWTEFLFPCNENKLKCTVLLASHIENQFITTAFNYLYEHFITQ